jgi:hypothetical protein
MQGGRVDAAEPFQDKRIASIPKTEVGKAADVRSFGATGKFFRIAAVKDGEQIRLPLNAADVALLQPDTLRLFLLDARSRRWTLIPESKYDQKNEILSAKVPGPGIYTVFGASRFEEVYDIQMKLCAERGKGRLVPPICKYILCPPEGFAENAIAMNSEVPVLIPPGQLAGGMGNVCEMCLKGGGGPLDFPECGLPDVRKPPKILDPHVLFPWPFKPHCFDASNGCTPGPYKVGQVDYNFENEFDLIPSGSTTPAYPGVDVRATVRYPATATGTGLPVAGTGRYPLILFLHGNHATCPCSCSHSCVPGDRIPNHLGYNYLLDILASWGFIAVSIDGFDVTCAWSAAMSDYEARGRLVLRHLQRWKDWDMGGTDPWSGLFQNRVNMNRIGLSGHSRGGEGVVAAEYINRTEGLGFAIRAVNAIAPTDQDPYIRYVPEVPYYLLLAASDGDVSNLQGLRTYDRTSLASATTQSEKAMLWVYGANHNFFNSVWTPAFGFACSSDDGVGEGRLSDSLQRLVACQSLVPFFRLHVQNESGYRKLFRGEVAVKGLEGVETYWTFQHPTRKEIDNFDTGDNPNTNSLGGAVTTSGGFMTFDEYEFKSSGPDLYNSSFRHFTHGLVLGWNSTQSYETVLPAGQRDVSAYSALALRISQILDGGVLNPLDTPRTFRVGLRTTTGIVSNVDFDVASLQSVPYPYEYNGGKTVLGMIRIPLKSFRNGNVAMPLTDIERVLIEFRGTGLVAIDDIQFTK